MRTTYTTLDAFTGQLAALRAADRRLVRRRVAPRALVVRGRERRLERSAAVALVLRFLRRRQCRCILRQRSLCRLLLRGGRRLASGGHVLAGADR